MIIYHTLEDVSSDFYIRSCILAFAKTKNIDLPSFNIIRLNSGKPIVDVENIFFSLSHSNSMTAIAIDTSIIGLDIEKLRKLNYIPIVNRFNKKNINNEKLFFEWWCSSEAYSKATDIPLIDVLNLNLNEFEFDFDYSVPDFLFCIYKK